MEEECSAEEVDESKGLEIAGEAKGAMNDVHEMEENNMDDEENIQVFKYLLNTKVRLLSTGPSRKQQEANKHGSMLN